MTTLNFDEKNRTIALNPSLSFIVQAPAGSGKTELLTQRYLSLLATVSKPEEIMAITFTRKAAAEMRHRIIKALSQAQTMSQTNTQHELSLHQQKTFQLASAALSQNSKKQWNILENPNRLRISTIDSLANRISSQIPILSGFGASPQISENAELYYQQAVIELFQLYNESYQTNPIHSTNANDPNNSHNSQLNQWQKALHDLLLHLDNRISQVEVLLIDMLRRREQWLTYLVGWDQESSLVKDNLRKQLEFSLQSIINEHLEKIRKNFPNSYSYDLMELIFIAANYFSKNEPDHPLITCLSLKSLPEAHHSQLTAWQAIAQCLLTQEGQWRQKIDKRQGFPPDQVEIDKAQSQKNKNRMIQLLQELSEYEILRQALAELPLLPKPYYSENQWQIINSLSQVLPILVAQLNILFQQHGVIDFVGLNLSALHALGTDENPTDLTLHLDYQIHHLLIDEFQDTSVIQFALIERLISGWQQGDGRTLFLVGDPMQSIYRFRNAEVGLFLRTAQYGIGSLSLQFLNLEQNFRSDATIIDWVNSCFPKIFPDEENIALGAVPYKSVQSTKQQENNYYGVHYYPLLTPTHDRSAEADQVIKLIQHYQHHEPDSSLAILVRSRSQLTEIIANLHRHQINFDAVAIEPLINYPEIQDLITLTCAVMHRADRTAWLSLLRAPWCGLTLADLLTIAEAANQTTIWQTLLSFEALPLTEEGYFRLKRVVPILARGLYQQGRLAFTHWLESIWLMLGGPATLEDESALIRAQTFFQLLDKLTKQTPLISIHRLNLELEQLYAEPKSNSSINIFNEKVIKKSAIQIMTIHKAKGLEFDHVIIPGLNQRVTSESEKLLLWLERLNQKGGNDLILAPIKSREDSIDPIYRYLASIEKEKLNYESARLFYVAVTRAKKSLHLLATIFSDVYEQTHSSELKKNHRPSSLEIKFSPSPGSFLKLIWPFYQDSTLSLLNKLPLNNSTYLTQSSSTEQNLLQEHPEKMNPNLLTRLSLKWQLPTLPFNDHLDISLTKTDENLEWVNLPLSNNYQRNLGTVIHETLHQIALTGFSSWQPISTKIISFWQQRLLALGTGKLEIEEACRSIQKAIDNILSDPKGLWVLNPEHQDIRHEYALVGLFNAAIKHVVIDLTFIDHTTNTRWIIDYKTSSPQPEEDLTDFLQREKQLYFKQLQQYATIFSDQETRPIRLGLYFPLCKGWIEWPFLPIFSLENERLSNHVENA